MHDGAKQPGALVPLFRWLQPQGDQRLLDGVTCGIRTAQNASRSAIQARVLLAQRPGEKVTVSVLYSP
jgi:hypothetical protein